MTRTDRAQQGPSLISKSQIFFCLARPYLVNNHSIIEPSIFFFFPLTFFQLASREGPTKLETTLKVVIWQFNTCLNKANSFPMDGRLNNFGQKSSAGGNERVNFLFST